MFCLRSLLCVGGEPSPLFVCLFVFDRKRPMKTARWWPAAILLLVLAVVGANGRPSKEEFRAPPYRAVVRFRHKVLTAVLLHLPTRGPFCFIPVWEKKYTGTLWLHQITNSPVVFYASGRLKYTLSHHYHFLCGDRLLKRERPKKNTILDCVWHIWAAISFERWKFLVFFCSAGHWPLAETRHFCECLKSYFKEGKKTLFPPSLTCGWFLLFFFWFIFTTPGREKINRSEAGGKINGLFLQAVCLG